jgi:hypothetical protein
MLPMQKSMLKIVIFLFCFLTSFLKAQTLGQDILNLVDDAVWYADKYVTPATDGAVYMTSSGWMITPQKKEPWKFTISLHNNVISTPKTDRNFTIKNSDFKFFTIKDRTSATVPSSVGNNHYETLEGFLHIDATTTEKITATTPEGVNQNLTYYAYLQGSFSIGYGIEFLLKYSPKIHLEHADYQVYGFGIQHNLDQYIPYFKNKKINIAILGIYSYEELKNTFLTIKSKEVNFGINSILGKIYTYQFQLNASKQYKKFEFMGGIIANSSDFEYFLGGEDSTISMQFDGLNFKEYLNKQMEKNYKTHSNILGEVSARYNLYKGLYAQSVFGFGKFINGNFSVQYQF